MFKKILCLSFAIFLIMFMWNINAFTNKLPNSVNHNAFLDSSSSVCRFSSEKRQFFKKGESYQLEKKEDLHNILSFYNAKLELVEEIEDGTNYYAYSKDLRYCKEIKGKIINLHIFIGKNKTIIGTPLIFGSF